DVIATAGGYRPSERTKIRMRTGGSSATIKAHSCRRNDDDDGLIWDISSGGGGGGGGGNGEGGGRKVRLPVRFRYRSPVFFEFHPSSSSSSSSGVGGNSGGKKWPRRGADAYASIWLQDVPDGEERDFDLPIWRCNNATRLSQNYITPDNVGS